MHVKIALDSICLCVCVDTFLLLWQKNTLVDMIATGHVDTTIYTEIIEWHFYRLYNFDELLLLGFGAIFVLKF